jgi:DNA-binding NarL/FixJ family response regulator
VLAYLKGEPPYADSARPDLILVNLDVTRPEHCDILRQIKINPQFRRIPLLVISSRDSYEDAFQAYDLNANAYIIKPESSEEYIEVMRKTLAFWLNLARLPQD